MKKVIDDLLLTGNTALVNSYLTEFHKRFNLGTVVHGLGQARFYGLQIVQHEDMACPGNGNKKLHGLEPYLISRSHRFQSEIKLMCVEKSAFMSLNSSMRIAAYHSITGLCVLC